MGIKVTTNIYPLIKCQSVGDVHITVLFRKPNEGIVLDYIDFADAFDNPLYAVGEYSDNWYEADFEALDDIFKLSNAKINNGDEYPVLKRDILSDTIYLFKNAEKGYIVCAGNDATIRGFSGPFSSDEFADWRLETFNDALYFRNT